MAIWFTSDWHIGETRFEIMNRPDFGSAQDMVDELVRLHNSMVAPDDLVIHAGDVCFEKAPEYLEQVDRFNGVKWLTRGNHDRGHSDEDLLQYFDRVVGETEGIEMDVEGLACYVTHYPTNGREDRFNIVGHIHNAWKFQLNMLNVGVDVSHFRPIPASMVPRTLNSINTFYDDDAWAAYAPCNERFRETRGLKGNRLRGYN